MYPTYPDNVQRIGVKTKSAKPKNYTIKSTTGDDEDDPQSLDENVDSEENEDDDVELEDGDDDIEDDE